MKRVLVAIASMLLLVACSGAASTPLPTPAPTTIATAEDAANRVMELYPSLAGIGPRDPNVIGGCCAWEAAETGDGFRVTFEVGWGDCPAGCINRHAWTFAVTRDGTVGLIDEQGSPVPSGVPGFGMGNPGGSGGTGGGILPGGTGVQGHVLAGPTCPVQQPGDPACADRPLAGVTVIALASDGSEAARTTSDATGAYAMSLPPGPYTIEPQAAEGVMRAPGPIPVVVADGYATVDIPYDTGIR
jgi:Carboxypeptidase regulatory-like domain